VAAGLLALQADVVHTGIDRVVVIDDGDGRGQLQAGILVLLSKLSIGDMVTR
jgi:hypothetical protein